MDEPHYNTAYLLSFTITASYKVRHRQAADHPGRGITIYTGRKRYASIVSAHSDILPPQTNCTSCVVTNQPHTHTRKCVKKIRPQKQVVITYFEIFSRHQTQLIEIRCLRNADSNKLHRATSHKTVIFKVKYPAYCISPTYTA